MNNVWNCHTIEDLKKAFGYAKRLLPIAKLGVLVNVSQTKLTRSTDQNAYYWGVVLKQMADEYGCSPSEMHKILGNEFLKQGEIKAPDGKIITDIKSTAKLKTDAFEEYLEKCRRYAAENLHIVVLLPNESEDMWSHK